MNIPIRHIIRPTYMAWTALLLSVAFFFQSLWIAKVARDSADKLIDEAFKEKEALSVKELMSPTEKYLKISSMHMRIIGAYGLKYHPKKSHNDQGIKRKADVVREMVELTELLSLPEFSMAITAKVESSFGPEARTFHPVTGGILEAGMYQHRQEAVKQAKHYYGELPSVWRKRCAFVYNRQEDLFDPINASRVEAILTWGSLRQYRNDRSWGITAKHWGLERIEKYYSAGILPPAKFSFNKGTPEEHARNPFTYYFIWEAHHSQFSRFDVRVYVDQGYIDRYMAECSKVEWEFIYTWKYVAKMIDLAEKIEEDDADHKKGRAKDVKRIKELARKTEAEYKKIQGIVRSGRFKHIDEIFVMWKPHFKFLAQQLADPEVKARQKVILWGYVATGALVLALALLGVIAICLKIFRRKKKNKK